MQLKGKTVVLTGAAGGMGRLMAAAFAERGARLVLADLNEAVLRETREQLGAGHTAVTADLCTEDGRRALIEVCRDTPGPHVLVNAAGISDFSLLDATPESRIELAVKLNLTVPMLLTRALLPMLSSAPEAAIVNIGSAFGAIGHPGFSVYCATKFGLHGFSEALRRELADSDVGVYYLAPRATRTDMNTSAVVELNKALGNAMDAPEVVVATLMRVIERKKPGDYYIGWPERLFVRLNAVLPGVVDAALARQLNTIREFAGGSSASA